MTTTLAPLCICGVDYKTHVFRAEIEPDAEPSFGRMEASEDISGYAWVPISDIRPDAFEALGVRDEITMLALLALTFPQSSRPRGNS